MNKEYWNEFYKIKREIDPTTFALFCNKVIKPESIILDLGCGNGRDSYYFANCGHTVTGIDFATKPKDRDNVKFIKTDFGEMINREPHCDVIYSRFFLHSITETELQSLLNWSKGFFMAEFRCEGDEPALYKDHKRNFINTDSLIMNMIQRKYKIILFQKSYGLAPYKNEDPLVGRIIAKR